MGEQTKNKAFRLGFYLQNVRAGLTAEGRNSRHLNTHIQTMPNENHGIMDFPLQNVRAGLAERKFPPYIFPFILP